MLILRFLSIIPVTLKRIISQRGLSLAILLGLSAAVALMMSIPLYADAVYLRTFHQDIATVGEGTS